MKFDISMAEHSQWKAGGKIAAVACPTSKIEISGLINWCALNELPYVVIGGTTNLLFCDEDIDAIAIHIGSHFSTYAISDNSVIASSGIWVPKLAKVVMHAGLSGIEHICGIPGSLGGLVVMNGGSQRKNIDKSIKYVETIDSGGRIKKYQHSDCEFEYRGSVFQKNKEVIVEIQLALNEITNRKTIRREMLSILRDRRKKFPRKTPNCGSVFQSRGDVYDRYGPPGKIIEKCGLKGLNDGRAQVSLEHANFIVNKGGAKASEIKNLINTVRDQVYDKYNVVLEVEPKYVDGFGSIIRL